MSQEQINDNLFSREYKPEDIEFLLKREDALYRQLVHVSGVPFDVIGCDGRRIGDPYKTYFNNGGTLRQLDFALALCNHPLVEELAGSKEYSSDERIREIMQQLNQERALEGLRILDLGSGIPTFARSARWLGAEVWTTALHRAPAYEILNSEGEPHSEYKRRTKGMTEEALRAELEHHIVVDFNHPHALRTIEMETVSGFDLVTESSLDVDDFSGGADIAFPLTRDGGLYLHADVFVECRLKEPESSRFSQATLG